jgi:uncharacterized membrane protein YcaP (DUF421 family)
LLRLAARAPQEAVSVEVDALGRVDQEAFGKAVHAPGTALAALISASHEVGTVQPIGAVAQECARAALVFGYGLLLVRIVGRRVFGRWAAIDIVVSIMVGSNLSRALTGNSPLFPTLAATTLLMFLHWLLAQAAARSPAMSRLFEGRARVLGRNGQVEHRRDLRTAISDADLEEALRQAGVERADQTRLLVLEPSGKISVLK